MKCANPDCSYAELTKTDPCLVCKRGVHHLCSNELYDSGSLSERFCSALCVYKWKTITSPTSTPAESELALEEASELASDSQVSSSPLGQPSEPGSPAASVGSVVDLTTSSDDSSGVDAFGIPLEILHYRQLGSRHDVWDIMHRLATPYPTKNNEEATHICLLCAQEKSCKPYASPDAWKAALHRVTHSTNARGHIYAAHRTHPLWQMEADKRMKRAVQHLGEARVHETKRVAPMATNERPSKQRGTLQKLWSPTQKEIGVFIAYWLISAGLPHNTVATEDFKQLIRCLSGDPTATILSAAIFRDLLDAVFATFCKLTALLLTREFVAALRFPFLNLHHDTWTTANGKTGVLGTSACWIDESWTPREIALLVTVTNGSHAAIDVKKLICTRVAELYGIDIDAMTQFTVSDTTASARKVSKLFEDSIPTDCTMHVLNLCLQYGMGMRENKETVKVYDSKTDVYYREQRYCTVGGVFKEGRDLIKRVRALNNYFSTPQRCQRLEDVQSFYSLPKLATTLDWDTRVAYTVKLFQRSIVNYSAFRGFFQNCENGEDATVFECLTFADWQLMAEMEAIVGPIADLARIEVQRNALVASELIVLLKFAAESLHRTKFQLCDIDAPRATTTTARSLPRYEVPIERLSKLARTCTARMKGQVEQRISAATPETGMILMLDPRTKFSVETLVKPIASYADGDDEEKEAADVSQRTKATMVAGQELLFNAHREVYCALYASSEETPKNGTSTTAANFDLVPTTDDERSICGAPIKPATLDTTPASTLHEQADNVLQKWLEYSVDWVAVALQQSVTEGMSKDDFTPLLMVRRNGVVCWRADAVCEHVNILQWFREVGRVYFPSIAALARVWLGRSPSNAFQERVFSTGGFVMSNLRTRTDNQRAEMQVLLKHNRAEIRRMERGSGDDKGQLV